MYFSILYTLSGKPKWFISTLFNGRVILYCVLYMYLRCEAVPFLITSGLIKFFYYILPRMRPFLYLKSVVV